MHSIFLFPIQKVKSLGFKSIISSVLKRGDETPKFRDVKNGE